MKFEKDLIKQIDKRLGVYQMTGECEFYLRINSGHVKTYFGSYLKLANKGTPDYLAIIRNRSNGITGLFLEAKSDTGKLSKIQEEFNSKYNSKDCFAVLTITDIKQLDKWIEKYAKDFVACI